MLARQVGVLHGVVQPHVSVELPGGELPQLWA
jgi:hypothetical protein